MSENFLTQGFLPLPLSHILWRGPAQGRSSQVTVSLPIGSVPCLRKRMLGTDAVWGSVHCSHLRRGSSFCARLTGVARVPMALSFLPPRRPSGCAGPAPGCWTCPTRAVVGPPTFGGCVQVAVRVCLALPLVSAGVSQGQDPFLSSQCLGRVWHMAGVRKAVPAPTATTATPTCTPRVQLLC